MAGTSVIWHSFTSCDLSIATFPFPLSFSAWFLNLWAPSILQFKSERVTRIIGKIVTYHFYIGEKPSLLPIIIVISTARMLSSKYCRSARQNATRKLGAMRISPSSILDSSSPILQLYQTIYSRHSLTATSCQVFTYNHQCRTKKTLVIDASVDRPCITSRSPHGNRPPCRRVLGPTQSKSADIIAQRDVSSDLSFATTDWPSRTILLAGPCLIRPYRLANNHVSLSSSYSHTTLTGSGALVWKNSYLIHAALAMLVFITRRRVQIPQEL